MLDTGVLDEQHIRQVLTGYRIQDTGYRIQDTGYRIQDTGYRIQDTGYRIHKYRIKNVWCCRIQDSIF